MKKYIVEVLYILTGLVLIQMLLESIINIDMTYNRYHIWLLLIVMSITIPLITKLINKLQ